MANHSSRRRRVPNDPKVTPEIIDVEVVSTSTKPDPFQGFDDSQRFRQPNVLVSAAQAGDPTAKKILGGLMIFNWLVKGL